MATTGPVLLLSVDTLRADRFTEVCFPESMSILETDFANFTNAHSHGNATPFAFPGIIAGHPVIGNGRFPDEIPTIADLFDRRTTGFSNNGHLTIERGYDRGFDGFHDQHPPDWSPSTLDRLKSDPRLRNSDLVVKGYRTAKRLADRWGRTQEASSGFGGLRWSADRVSEFVQRRVGEGDAFVWGHYMDPHRPFTPAMAVDGPDIDRTVEEIEWLNDSEHTADPLQPNDMAFLEALYEANIRYFDRELARLLREFRTKEWYDDALIVLVGDHGELFGEHGYMFHPMGSDPYDELIRTPLLVKYPDNEHAGDTFDHLVQHSDILATIAANTGAGTDGIPETIHPLTDPADRFVISKSNAAIRVTENDATALRRRDGTSDGVSTISSTGQALLDEATFPAVETLSGSVNGIEDMQRQRQLEALGYR